MQGLLPEEEVKEQVNASFRQIDGILLITNVRLLWKRIGDPLYTLNENRLNLKSVQKAQDPKIPNRFVIRVEVQGIKKPYLLSFQGIDAEVKSENVTRILQQKPTVQEVKSHSLEQESIFKIYELHQNPHLKELFDELVISKGRMTEKEFWESSGDFSKDALTSNQSKKDSNELLSAGISNRPFLLVPRQNVITQKSEYTLEPADCQRLLKEFPELRASYEGKVPLKKKENEFWQEFLDKNFKYKTEIFRGDNPIFIPYTTDEKQYEDKYIHNPNLLLAKSQNPDQVPKKALLDVNYVENTEMNSLPSGYGTYQKQQEIDAVNAALEQIDNDFSVTQKKDLENKIKAKKIINKYNQNSQRIIQSNNTTRNLELTDHTLQLSEHIHSKEEGKINLQPLALKKTQQFEPNELANILNKIRSNLNQSMTQIPKPQIVDSETMQSIFKKMISDINKSIQLLSYQKETDLVKKKIPPPVLDKMVFYYKKYKVLLRHCYSQFERFSQPEVFKKIMELMAVIKEEATKLDAYLTQESMKKYLQLFSPLRKMYNKLNQNFTLLYNKAQQEQKKVMEQNQQQMQRKSQLI